MTPTRLNAVVRKLPGVRALVRVVRALPSADWYLVGGPVRDLLRSPRSEAGGASVNDVDIVVTKTPLAVLERTLRKHGKVNLVGKRFGVLKFTPRGKTEAIDIALPRTDHYDRATGKYRDVRTQSDPRLSIEEDLSRRDFTVNAMAVNLRTGELVDPFRGQADLTARRIRAVGDPSKRFREDESRVLRALRFATLLRGTIEPKTWIALKRFVPKLKGETVPREVVAKEFVKTFAQSPGAAFDWYERSGAFRVLLPEIETMKRVPQPRAYHREGDVFVHTRIAVRLLESPAFKRAFPKTPFTPQLAVTTLLHDVGKPPTLRTPKKHGVNRIRFDGHADQGADRARNIAERLKLASTGMIDVDALHWAIKHHLIGLRATLDHIKETTFAKYFLNPATPGDLLLQLIWADGGATVPEGKRANRGSYTRIRQRIAAVRKRLGTKQSLPPPLLNGTEVMQLRHIPSGPFVGQILQALREEQLAGRIRKKSAARAFVEQFRG
ncbi:MAG: CCA tRNA nucleotidyltransferase [Candidatus Kerfeldbacteria bacterium]|nr:CCA tRNA nucleotidyltransferase [Candidatus Kerfeldbacteria bacterium]